MDDDAIQLSESFERHRRAIESRMARRPSITDRIYTLMSLHRDIIEIAGVAICLECGRHTKYEEFVGEFAWADGGQTAVCPHCGVDKIVPVLTPDVLNRAYVIEAEAGD